VAAVDHSVEITTTTAVTTEEVVAIDTTTEATVAADFPVTIVVAITLDHHLVAVHLQTSNLEIGCATSATHTTSLAVTRACAAPRIVLQAVVVVAATAVADTVVVAMADTVVVAAVALTALTTSSQAIGCVQTATPITSVLALSA